MTMLKSRQENRGMDHGRHIVLDGASNVRDLTWLLGSQGTGRLLRSANLDRLSSEGRRHFGDLGIGVVIDLRGKAEAAEAPDLGGTTRVHLPIEPNVIATLVAEQTAGTLSAASAMRVMERTYRHYIVDHTAVFAALLNHVLAANKRSILIHCAAGKDRTGVAAALVLTALDVPRAAVMEDYLLSNRYFRPTKPRSADVLPDEVRDAIIKVQPSYLEAAFAAMSEGWGGPGGYLEKALGVGLRERAAIRAALA
jgi:protein-tyrosine phosphatase